MENQSVTQSVKSIFQSNTFKLFLIGFVTLILLIPLAFVQDLIQERTQRKNEVVTEVSQLWGENIQFMGPILKIPYQKTVITGNKAVNIIEYAYFLPNKLINNTQINKNNSLKRSLYNPIVFSANMQVTGEFTKPNFEKIAINPEQIIWEKASILIKTTNLKSIKSDLFITAANTNFSLESKTSPDDYGTLETNTFDYNILAKNNQIPFKFNISFNGSNSVQFIPAGKTTYVNVKSNWESPSFMGAFAANDTTKKISKKGFEAQWKILDINRSFSQQFSKEIPDLNPSLFGVKLIETVDQYQQSERASKYGFLVIALTFLVFFLIQTISKINIHIFQYIMLGLALVMFYTLLISITEHTKFSIAYFIATLAVLSMIVLYSKSILKNNKFPTFIGLALSGLYGFIYVIIQLENYALLVGSIGLFIILGAVMYFSKNIDWSK